MKKLFVISFLIISIKAFPGVLPKDKTEEHNIVPDTSLLQDAKSDISLFKDIAEIIFFGSVILVSALTYNQARKTIFTPLKTETFKLQLKYFEEVLQTFGKFKGVDIDDKFDFGKIFKINSELLFVDYISLFYKKEIQIDEESIKNIKKQACGAVLSREYVEKHLEIMSSPIKAEPKTKPEIDNPAVIASHWKEYQFGAIHYTPKYDEESEHLRRLSTQPLLPLELRNLIEEFSEKTHENLTIIGETLTEIAKTMPEKYPTKDSVLNRDFNWMWNLYNDKKNSLDSHQQKILDYISSYLDVEKVLK